MLPTDPISTRLTGLGRKQARVIWTAIAAAFVAAVVGALVAASLVPVTPNALVGTVFLLVAGVVVPADLVVAYVVSSRMRRRPVPAAAAGAIAAAQVIVGCAVALSAGLMCCIFFFVSRAPLLLLLLLPCAAVLLHWFPSQARWAALARPAMPGEPRRSVLVRW